MSFTDEILDHFRGEIKEVNLVTSGGGVFEVTINGKLVYSKKKTGSFPDTKEVIKEMEEMNK